MVHVLKKGKPGHAKFLVTFAVSDILLPNFGWKFHLTVCSFTFRLKLLLVSSGSFNFNTTSNMASKTMADYTQ